MSAVPFDDRYTEQNYLSSIQKDFTRRALTYNNGPNGKMHREMVAELLETHPPSYPLLDIACGTGLVAEHLAREGDGVTGLDLTEGMLEKARLLNPKGTFIQGRAEHLPFDDAAFQSVYCCSAMAYFTDIPGAVREAYRVLKRGGHFAYQAVSLDSYILGVVLEKSLWETVGETEGAKIFRLPHGPTNDEAANEKLMRDAGFENVKVVKYVRNDKVSVEQIDRFWGGVVKDNGILKRVTVMEAGLLEKVRQKWVDKMEVLRGADNFVNDRVTSWLVYGVKPR